MCEMYPNPEGADPKLRAAVDPQTTPPHSRLNPEGAHPNDGEVPNPADGEVPRRCVRYIQNTCKIH